MPNTFSFSRSCLLALALLSVSVPARAQLGGVTTITPNSLRITLKRFELCADVNCSNPVVLGTGDSVFDMASQSAGQDIGDYVPNASIPRGVTYPYVRTVIGRTLQIKGAVSVNGAGGDANGACYTGATANTAGSFSGGGLAANLSSAQEAAALQSITLVETEDLGGSLISETYTANTIEAIMRLPTPLRIEPSTAAPQIVVSIDAADSLSFEIEEGGCVADFETLAISVSAD